MSTISKSNSARAEAREAYVKACVDSRNAENATMNAMLNLLRTSKTPLTAAQISFALEGAVSVPEAAANLIAMREGHSRYAGYQSALGHRVDSVAIPTGKYNQNSRYYSKPEDREAIRIKGGGSRVARMVELDSEGHIIPNTTRDIRVYEANRYTIERIDY